MVIKKPTLTIDDFEGDTRLFDMAGKVYGPAWDKANPSGTLVGNYQAPKIDSAAVKAAGGDIGDWAAISRVVNNVYDKADKTGTAADIPAAVTQGIADGSIDNMGAANNYGALAAGKLADAENMGSFSYDFNKDPIFKILSASYMQQARDAASDASAMAAARTGGYGNSYGATAAAQQYNRALGDLYDQVPELQAAAYARYQNDRNALLDQADRYQALSDSYYNKGVYQDETAYNREQDAKNRAFTEATTLAQLGEYGKLGELTGVDMSNARNMDQFNQLMQLMSLMGDSAPAMLSSIYEGNASLPDTPAFQLEGTQDMYRLPPDSYTSEGHEHYFLKDGKPYVLTIKTDGTTTEKPYTGIVYSMNGDSQYNIKTGETSPYTGNGNGFTTGNAMIDNLLKAYTRASASRSWSNGIPTSLMSGSYNIGSGNYGGYGGYSQPDYDYRVTPRATQRDVEPDIVADTAAKAVDKSNNNGYGNGYGGDSGGGNGGGTYVPQAQVPGGDSGGGTVTVQTTEIPDAYLNTIWKIGKK